MKNRPGSIYGRWEDEGVANPTDLELDIWKALPEHIRKLLEASGYVDGKMPDHLKKSQEK